MRGSAVTGLRCVVRDLHPAHDCGARQHRRHTGADGRRDGEAPRELRAVLGHPACDRGRHGDEVGEDRPCVAREEGGLSGVHQGFPIHGQTGSKTRDGQASRQGIVCAWYLSTR